jgi:hypothetical protein
MAIVFKLCGETLEKPATETKQGHQGLEQAKLQLLRRYANTFQGCSCLIIGYH